MKTIKYYQTEVGKEPVREWLKELDKISRLKIYAYIERVALGSSKKSVKPLGDGIFEIKIDYGPGHRLYFGQVKNALILLLAGGDKSSQFRDIARAKEYWRNYVSKQ